MRFFFRPDHLSFLVLFSSPHRESDASDLDLLSFPTMVNGVGVFEGFVDDPRRRFVVSFERKSKLKSVVILPIKITEKLFPNDVAKVILDDGIRNGAVLARRIDSFIDCNEMSFFCWTGRRKVQVQQIANVVEH